LFIESKKKMNSVQFGAAQTTTQCIQWLPLGTDAS